jgi:hypothetical protein
MNQSMKVGVKYWNEKGEALYVTKIIKATGTIHSSTKPKCYRPFTFQRAAEIQYLLTQDGLNAIKVYE